MEEIGWKAWIFAVVCAEPAVVVLRFEDEGQTIVDGGDEFVGLGGNEGEALEPVADWDLPTVPEAGKGKGPSSAMEMAKTRLIGFAALARLDKFTGVPKRSVKIGRAHV